MFTRIVVSLLFVAGIFLNFTGCTSVAHMALTAAAKSIDESAKNRPPAKTYSLDPGDLYPDAIATIQHIDPKAKVNVTDGNGDVVSKVRIRGKNRVVRSEFRDNKLYRIIDAKTGEVYDE